MMTMRPDGANTKLKDLSGNFSFVDGRIVVTGSTAGADPADLKKLFGTENISLGTVQGSQSEYSAGVNAKVVIDGVTTERSSNSFSYNGLNIDLVSTSPKDADGNFITETISVSRGTDQIVEGIKGFIEDYNELIGRINELLDEDTSYRDYPPLTDAQKKEMSEKEIELWEEKAKEGLLRNDSTLSGFVQSMRSILYEKPEGCSYALYNLGIETGEWEDKGKLVMSADGEARLRQVLESNPDEVMRLFTDEEEGIAVKLNKVIDETAKVSSADPGSLVSLAGVKGKASETQNTLYERLKEIDEKITTLKNSYEKEKERYWKQFNTMEQLISNMNTQSSWLAMQFS